MANFDVSKSKPYFDQVVVYLNKYSPNAVVFCLLHKVDLIDSTPEKKEKFFRSLKEHFIAQDAIDIQYYTSSIFDASITSIFNEISSIISTQQT